MTFSIYANGEATLNQKFLRIRAGIDRSTGQRYFYIPEDPSRGLHYAFIEDMPRGMWNDHAALEIKMLELESQI